MQCICNWVPRRGVKGSERRNCVMAEEFYWRSKICTYELKSVWQYSTLITLSLWTVALGIFYKQRRHGMHHFDFFNLTIILTFYFLKRRSNAQKNNDIFERYVILFLHVTYIKGKSVLVFYFIFELLWRGRGSSVISVAF
jgi:hypothetical protein